MGLRNTIFGKNKRKEFVGTFKWFGAILGPNGKIYASPRMFAYNYLEINYSNNNRLVGGTYGVGGQDKFNGCVLAPNGRVYSAPRGYNKMLSLDIATLTTQEYTIPSPVGESYVGGGTLAPNGKLYFAPSSQKGVLEFDPTTNTGVLLPIPGVHRTARFASSILAPNGNIYFNPLYNGKFLELNLSTMVFTEVGVSMGANDNSYSSVLGNDGMIYIVPYNNTTVKKFNPDTYEITDIGSTLSGGQKWVGGTLSTNGKIYCAPYGSNSILEIDIINNTTSLIAIPPVAQSYKYSGIVMDRLGTLNLIPAGALNVYKYTPPGSTPPDIEDTLIPSDLSTLQTSNYNKYFNKM